MKDLSAKYASRPILALLILFMSSWVSAQHGSFCGTEHLLSGEGKGYEHQTYAANPEMRMDEVLTIRTVVHVVYNTEAQNISDEDITTVLEKMNKLYLASNIDTSLVNSVHRAKIANTNIQFCLASEDPSGNPSNGITRTQTDTTEFRVLVQGSSVIYDNYKYDSSGGKSAWDTSRYLNIWIVPAGGANYGESMPEHYPIANYNLSSGIPGVTYDVSNLPPFNSSPFEPASVLAHECGHFLGLLHTFGFNPDDLLALCEVDDEIEDTPLCSLFSTTGSSDNTCIEPENDQPDNNTNIMSYSTQIMFTLDQSATMRNNILNASPELLADDNCSGMTTTAVSEPLLTAASFDIFPNPNTGLFTIEGHADLAGQDITYTAYDITGREVEVHVSGDRLSTSQKVDILGAKAGVYFLVIRSKSSSFTQKVIVR